MNTILVTGSDTGVGKTHVAAALARLCSADDSRVQIVKILETGTDTLAEGEGDAARAARLAGGGMGVFTLASFPLPLSPPAAAAAAGAALTLEALADELICLPPCDWRICEGAGGIATPVDGTGRDWADLATAIGAQAVVIVVPDRLGAINQARLAYGRALQARLPAGVWLNEGSPVDRAVANSNRDGLRSAGVPIWGEQAFGAAEPADVRRLWTHLGGQGTEREIAPRELPRRDAALSLFDRWRTDLAGRERKNLRRRLRVTEPQAGELNLADNDYLDLARDPEVIAAASAAAARHGTSASASPLVTGWREPHESLVNALGAWHGRPFGLLWSSGYAANSAVLGVLARRGDLILADRLIHHSLVAGILRSGARLRRHAHLDLGELERHLVEARREDPSRSIFVVTESVFSMDGDTPDLARLAELKRRHGFFWVLDEAHALGWYGREGGGLARTAGVEAEVDVLVGTLGKALASGGAYTLFGDDIVRDTLVNHAGEFIYSTAIPPAAAAAAAAALVRIKVLAIGQADWHASSRAFRVSLRAAGWAAPEGDSPIVPVQLDDEDAALSLAQGLAVAGIRAAAIRPPTVPAGTSRLRFSLKRTFQRADGDRVLAEMESWRKGR